MVFDVLYENGNLVNKPLTERKNILNKYSENDVFIKSAVFDKGVKLFNEIKKLNLEGIVAKLKNGTYHINSRTDDFIKIKNVKESTFYIGGYVDNKDAYVFSLILCEKVKETFKYVGKVSVSKKSSVYSSLKIQDSVNNFFDESIPDAIFVEPKAKCVIQYLEKTKGGSLRHPVFKGVVK